MSSHTRLDKGRPLIHRATFGWYDPSNSASSRWLYICAKMRSCSLACSIASDVIFCTILGSLLSLFKVIIATNIGCVNQKMG
jgi:hypothetical protein